MSRQLPLIGSTSDLPDVPPAWAAEWPGLPYTPYTQPWRQLMAAVLLQACLDAHRGDLGARYWLHSRRAACWASWLELPYWPPRLAQLASRGELARRVREGATR